MSSKTPSTCEASNSQTSLDNVKFNDDHLETSSSNAELTRDILDDGSTPSWNTTVVLIAFTACLSALFFGYDSGMANIAMVFATQNPDMGISSPLWQGGIVSAVPALAGVGALIAAPLSDKLGRKRVINLATALYTIGGLVAVLANSRYMLLLARIINGVFIGVACVLVPIYLSECSPVSVRGRMLSMFQISSNLGGIVSNLMAAAVSGLDPINVSWRLLFAFPCFLTVIQMAAFTFLPESPNWVYGHWSKSETKKILLQIYSGNRKAAAQAFEDIAVEETRRNEIQSGFSKIFKTEYVFRALILGASIQILNAFSGINTVVFFIGTTVKSIGITDSMDIIWVSLAVSVVLALFAFVPFFVVDRFGRRPLLLFSQVASGLALIVVAGSYYQVAITSGVVVPQASSTLSVIHCSQHASCASCIRDPECGFCGPPDLYTSAPGYCLPVGNNATCEGPTIGARWSFYEGHCHTPWSWVPLVCVLVFLAVFSVGFSSLPWVLNAEFYPLWARSKCAAMATAANWWSNLFISLTFLSVMEAITPYCTYLIFAVITFLGAFFVYNVLPETKGLPIEEIQRKFMPKKSVAHSIHMNLTDLNKKDAAEE